VAFLIGANVRKEELIAAMKECAASLGHVPSMAEFRKATAVGKGLIRKYFGTFKRLLEASSLEARGSGHVVEMKDLFADWAGIVERLKKSPTLADYEMCSKYSPRPLVRRFGFWVNVPAGMLEYARKEGLEGQWEEVVKVVRAEQEAEGREAPTSEPRRPARKQRVLDDRPIYGLPMFAPFSFAPTNEQGVLFVFGGVAHELGFSITRIQTGFPDVEAMREVGPNKCQRVTLEAEYESKNYLLHMHPLDGCDGIVCWIHNWPECPLEVIELRKVIKDRPGRKEKSAE
jgi:Homing endonuclease associated repeat